MMKNGLTIILLAIVFTITIFFSIYFLYKADEKVESIFQQEMAKICLTDHFAIKSKIADHLYQVKCISNKGEEKNYYLEE